MRVSEVYVSVQGEGPRVGKPTTFVRFGGCNLRCPGWACDTPHAIFPEQYRHEWVRKSPFDLDEETPKWTGNICLTGGEPFLQKHRELEDYVDRLQRQGMGVECFSNGAIEYPDWAIENVSFVLDWKLPGSGEETFNDVRINNVARMVDQGHAIKFTIANQLDYEIAKGHMVEYALEESFDIYMGVVWGKLENATLVDWILKDQLDVKLNVQVHNFVFDRNQRGI